MIDVLRKGTRALLALLLVAWMGCSSSETTSIKKDLTEEEKRQLQELNEQRASEWGAKQK